VPQIFILQHTCFAGGAANIYSAAHMLLLEVPQTFILQHNSIARFVTNIYSAAQMRHQMPQILIL
jgi:hypothetical protein